MFFADPKPDLDNANVGIYGLTKQIFVIPRIFKPSQIGMAFIVTTIKTKFMLFHTEVYVCLVSILRM